MPFVKPARPGDIRPRHCTARKVVFPDLKPTRAAVLLRVPESAIVSAKRLRPEKACRISPCCRPGLSSARRRKVKTASPPARRR